MGRGKRSAAGVRAVPVVNQTHQAPEPQKVHEEKPKRRRSDPIEGYSFFPSDLTWLLSDCRHCFYLKLKQGVKRPNQSMPGIFRRIDEQIRSFCMDKRTEEICPDMPKGRFIGGERWVRSKSVQLLGHKEKFCLRGRPDAVVQWDDGSYGVVDFKTSQVKAESAAFYGRQLEAYARALEDPHYAEERLAPVSRMGLLVFEPQIFIDGDGKELSLKGQWRWIEVPRLGVEFTFFIESCLTVLEADEAPEPSESCPYCKYRSDFQDKVGFTGDAKATTPPSSR